MTPDEIIAVARSAIGTPFRHQGRVVGRGLDCVGLGAFIADTLGIKIVDVTGYGRRPSGGILEATLDEQPAIVQVAGPAQPGDLFLIRFKGEPQHVAVFDGENIIHAYEPVGKVCEHRLTEAWSRRIVRIYRFRGVMP